MYALGLGNFLDALSKNDVGINPAALDLDVYKRQILTFRGVTGGHMRKPLLDLTDEQVAQLKQQVAPYI